MSASAPPASPAKNVLIVTASIGAGHNQVARTLMEQLRSFAPQVRVECLDAVSFCAPWFRAAYAGGFALSMAHFPRLYGLGFRLGNRPRRPGRARAERLRLRVERQATDRLGRELLARRPDLVVHCHFLSPNITGWLIRTGRLRCPQIVVVTDIETHRWWYAEGVDHWFLPNEYTAGLFARWGIGDERATVSGIPIHPKWTHPIDRREVLADWRLPEDRKIVVLAGGAEFTCGPIARVAQRIVQACPEAYMVVLAGRNRKLLDRLAALPESPGNLLGVPFTDRAQELVGVSSVMVTKPGGITTAECLAVGTPMVLMRPVPGHEAGNAEYFVRQGAGVIVRSYRRLPEVLAGLLRDPEALRSLSQNARRLYRPGTQTVIAAIRRMLNLPPL